MTMTSMVRRLVLASVALAVAVTLGVSLVSGSAPHTQIVGAPPDTTTVGRLTRDRLEAAQPPLAPSATVTETTAILSAELLLLGGFDFTLAMPLISR